MRKLLLDECVSWRIGKYLFGLFDEILHVDNSGLGDQPLDSRIYRFATEQGYAVMTKDDDFVPLALLSIQGAKVIRLYNAQLPVKPLADRILAQGQTILAFLDSEEKLLLVDIEKRYIG